MLDIGLIPKASGSTGFGRFYPHQGYLGLSPVTIEGSAFARLPPLCPTLPIRQVTITIRCAATRTIGTDVETTLWAKAKRVWEPSGDQEYEQLGDWNSPFKVVIPVEAAREAASSQWTRDLKVVWQIQVAFEHEPIPYVGNRIVKTYLLDIRSHLAPPMPPPSPPADLCLPGALVSINPPYGSFGPGDTFTLSLHVKPDDPNASIRRTTLIIERRTRLLDTPAAKPSPWRRSSAPHAYAQLEEAVTHTAKVVEVSSDESTPGSGGMFWVSMTGTIPKRGGKWEAGETGETAVASTTFDCRVKVTLRSKSKTNKEITCPPVSIFLVGSSAAERTAAHAAIMVEEHPKASLPKRKHRSSRRGLYMQEGTIDIANPVVAPAPILPPLVNPLLGVKPILLPSNPIPQPQSISFAFPARGPALPITTLIHPPSPHSPPSTSAYPDTSIIRRYQTNGRRISATTSEEEEVQPSRTRIRLDHPTAPAYIDRPTLPSLDVLGLRLPPVPEYDPAPRRPRTAPLHSAFPSSTGNTPRWTGGASGLPFLSPERSNRTLHEIRPVTSGGAAEKSGGDEGAFAFS